MQIVIEWSALDARFANGSIACIVRPLPVKLVGPDHRPRQGAMAVCAFSTEKNPPIFCLLLHGLDLDDEPVRIGRYCSWVFSTWVAIASGATEIAVQGVEDRFVYTKPAMFSVPGGVERKAPNERSEDQ